MRGAGSRPRSVSFFLAAALFAWAAARFSSPAGAGPPDSWADDTKSTVQDQGASTSEMEVERHSPRKGYPSMGPMDAPNTLIFFTDYECPVCPRPAKDLEQMVRDFGGLLRVEVHHNPLQMHRNAIESASAARAAQRQGKFWEYHEALLPVKSLTKDQLVNLAVSLGLDRKKFERDFEDPKLRAEVVAQAKEAQDANITGTPGFLINGHVEVGWASLPWFEGVIRKNLR